MLISLLQVQNPYDRRITGKREQNWAEKQTHPNWKAFRFRPIQQFDRSIKLHLMRHIGLN